MSNLTIIIIFAVVLVIAAIAVAAYFIIAGCAEIYSVARPHFRQVGGAAV